MRPQGSRRALPGAPDPRRQSGVGLARKLAFGLGAVAMGWIPSAVAQCQTVPPQIFAGADAGFSSYAYLGGGFPLIDGFGVRASAFYGGYKYESGGLGRVDARFGGAEAEVLYQFRRNGAWLDAGVGVRDIDTALTPFDSGNRRHGDQAEPVVVVDGGHVSGPWRFDGYGSYGARLDDYLVRGSLTHAVGGPWRLGLEGSGDGDPTYKEERVGPLGAVRFGSSSEALVSAGFAHQSGRGDGAYVRIGFNHSF
jgi:hypothetical protein